MNNTKKPLLICSSFLLFLFIFSLIGLSYLTNAGIDRVFIGLLPLLVYMLLLIVSFYYSSLTIQLILFGPLALCAIFFLLWVVQGSGIFADMDGPQIAVLNLLLSYLISAIVFFSRVIYNKGVSKEKRYYELYKSYAEEAKRLKDPIIKMRKDDLEKNLVTHLRNIEDKCKAINFVIGRVYSAKKGGNSKLREKIRIKREIYNLFSEIAGDFKKEDEEKLKRILNEILTALNHLELAEKEVFSSLKLPKLNLVRNPDGNDKLIDVLAKNDKDPVIGYYSEAKEICKNLSDSLESLEISKQDGSLFSSKNFKNPAIS